MVVVCFGEALIDLVPPAGTSPRTASQLAVQPGGAPLNVCVGLSRLGCNSLFLGCLSSDAFGTRLASLLESEDTPRVPDAFVANPTRLALVDHTNFRAPFRFYGDSPADSRVTREHVDEALASGDVTGLYVGSLMMTNDAGNVAQRYAIEQASEIRIPIYTDPNPRPSAWATREEMVETTSFLLAASTLAKLSLDDAAVLGWPETPESLIGWCEDRFGTQLFVTGGAAGCWANIDGTIRHISPPDIEPIDPTGAGDASFCALIARMQETGCMTIDYLRYAAAAGALTTLSNGAIAAFPTADQLEFFLASRG